MVRGIVGSLLVSPVSRRRGPPVQRPYRYGGGRPPSARPTIVYALMATVFDRILSGEIPCHRVYEDEHVLAFLDVGPLSPATRW